VAVRAAQGEGVDLTAAGVLVIADVFPPRHGGSGRWLWDLYRRLPDLHPTVLAGPADGDREFDRASSLPIERWPLRLASWGALGGAGGYAALARRTAAVVRRVQPRVVHCGKCLPEGLLGWINARRTGVPYWCFAHGEELSLVRDSRELNWLTGLVLRGAARVVANSDHTRRIAMEGWRLPGDRVVVLHPGVDATRFVPAAPDAAARESLGWTGRAVILTVGALQKRKGQDMMIRALPEIRRRCPDVLYAIAGEGWERAELERLAVDLGVADAVRFMGVPDEDALVRSYQQCDLFALPNRRVGWDFEGFGIVLLEAQACARPVIAGASGGTAEAILPTETGVLLPTESPAPLAEACSALLADPARRARMGARAREWILERFDWPGLTRQARSLFAPPSAAG
jgi:phosphatidylinositol alpha-1,6-mannosyltransferase